MRSLGHIWGTNSTCDRLSVRLPSGASAIRIPYCVGSPAAHVIGETFRIEMSSASELRHKTFLTSTG